MYGNTIGNVITTESQLLDYIPFLGTSDTVFTKCFKIALSASRLRRFVEDFPEQPNLANAEVLPA